MRRSAHPPAGSSHLLLTEALRAAVRLGIDPDAALDALELGPDLSGIVTYERRLADAVEAVGVTVVTPRP